MRAETLNKPSAWLNTLAMFSTLRSKRKLRKQYVQYNAAKRGSGESRLNAQEEHEEEQIEDKRISGRKADADTIYASHHNPGCGAMG